MWRVCAKALELFKGPINEDGLYNRVMNQLPAVGKAMQYVLCNE